MATFVLVHGGWRGGWVWDEVVPLLEAKGHSVYAPTLTGLAERSHLLSSGVNLDTHIQDLVQLIQFHELSDVYLCGHSSSGVVITGVADKIPGSIAALIYLDAFVPQDGDSVFSLSSDEYKLFAVNSARQSAGISIEPIPAVAFGLSGNAQKMMDKRSTPHPLATHIQGLALSGNHTKVAKKIFIFLKWVTDFPSPFIQFYDRLKDDSSWIVRDMEGSHDLMIESPQKVAALLEETLL